LTEGGTAEDLIRGEVDAVFHSGVRGVLNDDSGSLHVAPDEGSGICQRACHVGLRCGMNHQASSSHGGGHQVLIAHIALDKIQVQPFNVFQVSGVGQFVEYPHLVPLLHKMSSEV
jgi:hypothetical protein